MAGAPGVRFFGNFRRAVADRAEAEVGQQATLAPDIRGSKADIQRASYASGAAASVGFRCRVA